MIVKLIWVVCNYAFMSTIVLVFSVQCPCLGVRKYVQFSTRVNNMELECLTLFEKIVNITPSINQFLH